MGKGLNRYLTKKDRDGKQVYEKIKAQYHQQLGKFKTTMRQHYIPTQMAKTEGEGRGWTIPNAQEHVEQLELLYTACGNAKLPSLWKTV